jgi:hypothetical protein
MRSLSTRQLRGTLLASSLLLSACGGEGASTSTAASVESPAGATSSSSTPASTGSAAATNASPATVSTSVPVASTETSVASSTPVTNPAPAIALVPASAKPVTLAWKPPLTYTDGSSLGNLAGYRIYHSTDGKFFDPVADLANPGLTSFVTSPLPPGTHYFAMTAYTFTGLESKISNVGSRIVE